MILYGYDEQGFYTGPIAPPLSPTRPFIKGQPNYLRPVRSTDKAPPAAPAHQVPRFDGAAWVLEDRVPPTSSKAERERAAELAVLEAAERWVDLFERHVDHEVPLLPHNKAMWEAVRNLKAARGE